MVTWMGCDSDSAPLIVSPRSNWVPRLNVVREFAAWPAPATPIAPVTASTSAVLRRLCSINMGSPSWSSERASARASRDDAPCTKVYWRRPQLHQARRQGGESVRSSPHLYRFDGIEYPSPHAI